MHASSRRLLSIFLLALLLGGAFIAPGSHPTFTNHALAQDATPTLQSGGCSEEPTAGRALDPARGEFAFAFPDIDTDPVPQQVVFLRRLVIQDGDDALSECFPGKIILQIDQGIVNINVDAGFVFFSPGGCEDNPDNCKVELKKVGSNFDLAAGQAIRLEDAGFSIGFKSASASAGGQFRMIPGALLEWDGASGTLSGTASGTKVVTASACDGTHCH